jgi:hypothetical protein
MTFHLHKTRRVDVPMIRFSDDPITRSSDEPICETLPIPFIVLCRDLGVV